MAALNEMAARLHDLSPADQRALLARMLTRKKDGGRVGPPSYAQEQLWFMEKLAAGNPYYNESSAVRFLVPLDHGVLERALNEIVSRHEAMRTNFEDVNGELVQRVLPSLTIALPLTDLTGLPDMMREAEAIRLAAVSAREPFDLSRAPQMRFLLIRLAPADHIFVLTMHHIVCDGWSTKVFLDELRALCTAFGAGKPSPLPPLPIQFSDYVAWQRQRLSGTLLDEQLRFWKERLRGLQPLDLPTDFPRPAAPSFAGGRERFSIGADVGRRLRTLCGRESLTAFMALLAAFQALLHRYTGHEDIAVGCPVANRTRPELELLIGFFVNTVVVRTDLSGNPTFRELFKRVRDTSLSAFAHQDLPFEKVVEHLQPERDPSRNPLFQVTFQIQGGKGIDESYASTEAAHTIEAGLHTSKFDLRCDLWTMEDAYDGYIEYSADLFDAVTVRSMCWHYETMVTAMVNAPEQPISEVRLPPLPERQEVLKAWNDTAAAFQVAPSVHRRVEAAAAEYPERPAIESLTYAELNRRANQLARLLAARGVKRDGLVALVFHRSVDLVVAALAVWKCGAAYVPLDPSSPAERLALLLRESHAPLVITTPQHVPLIPQQLARFVLDDSLHEQTRREDPNNLDIESDPRSLAYVIFTSGSTGTPRGVEITHASLNNLIDWHRREYTITPSDRATLCASPAFDASVWETWPYLVSGASLHIPDTETYTSPEALASWMAQRGITISFLPTPVAELFIAAPLPHNLALRVLLTGGDKLRSSGARTLPFRFVNHYGPTECTVVATACQVGFDGKSATPPIGRPIANITAHVLDRYRRPVPLGVRGELYLGGLGLARGYLNDPELTRQRFIPMPLPDAPGSRLYRTGDLVRQRADGTLEFHGRVDTQVKLRGYRIEPSEIEIALDDHPLVQKSIVVARTKPDGEPALVAYFVPTPGALTANAAADERIDEWHETYNRLYAADAESQDDTLDIVGWKSTYTGEPLSADEMREQVEGTVERIAALAPKRILEIGCGTGMLLLRLAAACERYVATDFSAPVLTRVRQAVDRRGWQHVELKQAFADDFSAIESAAFDVVVLNSVVQYFPDIDYLLRVLAGATRSLRPGGCVFVGDIRNRRLLRLLLGSSELHRSHPGITAGELRARIERRSSQEVELLIDPEFFRVLPGRFENVAAVAMQIRRGRHHNELTRFRYDAWLRVGSEVPAPEAMDEQSWPGMEQLPTLLRDTSGPLRVTGVPSARLEPERRLIERLNSAHPAVPARSLITEENAGVEPETVWALAKDLKRAAHIIWSRDADPATYDVIFTPSCAPWWTGAVADEAKPWSSYANLPLSSAVQQQLIQTLRESLRRKLPGYMVPSAFVRLDALPLTSNGKLERQALPPPLDWCSGAVAHALPRSRTEQKIVDIWRDVLGLERIDTHDNFFDLGGHSLLLVKVHHRLMRLFATPLSIIDLFRLPTVHDLARAIEAEAQHGGVP